MANIVNSYLNLFQVVKSFLNERNEKALTNFERYLQFAIEGYSDMQLFTMNTIDVAYLQVDPQTNSALLPPDFITMTKIGINIRGRLWTLTLNNDIVLPPPESICSEPIDRVNTETENSVSGGYSFFPHYRNGVYIDTLYGLGGGFNVAYYRIDMNNRVIYFDGKVPNGEVILEYKSSGVKAGGALIPRQAVPALKAYIYWKSIAMDVRLSMSERQAAKMEYYERLHECKLLELSFTADEYLDVAYGNMSQGPKR
jgi:hypothetical protein